MPLYFLDIPLFLKILQILKLDDHLQIDNFKKVVIETVINDEKRSSHSKNLVEEKGIMQNYFNGEADNLWKEWIDLNLKGTDIVFPKFI